ncbi:PLP-dependent aminotransferase family protein [Enterovibrio sp. ZSDZ42]|uniref:PLP-dependent aminotransferase family protein n=1 Tax=Enterovibrio gelatinilyticus TaxID=2899819 RepID=A0ABT5QWF3_9GAMM|nr:PLP-dependent aminotransferase family protein [Enterovibrio sp. ZSDZ42]MDD1792353.1 PLP-dependent aminotransferase family protein [Enterovibrio sp. ZSDZ42]
MTINLHLELASGLPKYLAISKAIIEQISAGILVSGTKLPPHRELADQLSVSVQTVSNAYAHAEKQGAVEAWVGSGTFVRSFAQGRESEFLLTQDVKSEHSVDDVIDMSIAHPVYTNQITQLFNETLMTIAQSGDTAHLLNSPRPVPGQRRHIEAALHYLSQQKLNAEAECVLLTNGACHGLVLALGTAISSGDTVACERLVDHGLIARSKIFNFKLCGIDMDEQGIIPEALEKACQQRDIKALACTPSMSNPTNAHMGLERRIAIADIVRRYNLTLIEDDVYGALEPHRVPPISSIIPDQSFYVTSLTKTVAPGLRVGYLVVPRHLKHHAVGRLAATSWMATPLPFEIASHWIVNGSVERIEAFQRQEFAARQRLTAKCLSDLSFSAHPYGQHVWLTLPSEWQADNFLEAARQAGVQLTGYQPFSLDADSKINHVRISLGVEASRYRIKRGLQIVSDLVKSEPPPPHFLL